MSWQPPVDIQPPADSRLAATTKRPPSLRRSRWVAITAVIGLLAAELGFVLLPISPVVWVVGLVLFALSSVWTVPQKIAGFIWLGTGFLAPWILLFGSFVLLGDPCAGAPSVTLPDGTQQLRCADPLVPPGAVAFGFAGLILAYPAAQALITWMLVRSLRRAPLVKK
ncbi:MAG: hypothetical protein ACRCYU_22780 [Nocardioides sp.]